MSEEMSVKQRLDRLEAVVGSHLGIDLEATGAQYGNLAGARAGAAAADEAIAKLDPEVEDARGDEPKPDEAKNEQSP